MRDAHRAHYAYTNDETIEGHVRKQRQKMQDASARYIQLPGIKPRLSTSIDQPVEFYLLSSELSPVLIRSISPIIRFQTEVRVGDTFQCARKKQNKTNNMFYVTQWILVLKHLLLSCKKNLSFKRFFGLI